jgi:hypothetical protein
MPRVYAVPAHYLLLRARWRARPLGWWARVRARFRAELGP